MSIRFIFFDLGQVLVRFSNRKLLEQVGMVLGYSPQQVSEVLFVPEMIQKVECGQITESDYYEFLCGQIGFRPDRERFQEAVNAIFWLNDPMVEVTRKLSRRDFPRGILSNIGPWHWQHCSTMFPTIFRDIPGNHILSYEVGAMKPTADIFQAAFSLATKTVPDIAPDEILFIDDLEANIAGAQACGWDAIQYSHSAHERLLEELRIRTILT